MKIRMKSKTGKSFHRLGAELSPDEWTVVDLARAARVELERDGVLVRPRRYDDHGRSIVDAVALDEAALAAIAEREQVILRRLEKAARPVQPKHDADGKVIPFTGGGAIDLEIVP